MCSHISLIQRVALEVRSVHNPKACKLSFLKQKIVQMLQIHGDMLWSSVFFPQILQQVFLWLPLFWPIRVQLRRKWLRVLCLQNSSCLILVIWKGCWRSLGRVYHLCQFCLLVGSCCDLIWMNESNQKIDRVQSKTWLVYIYRANQQIQNIH